MGPAPVASNDPDRGDHLTLLDGRGAPGVGRAAIALTACLAALLAIPSAVAGQPAAEEPAAVDEPAAVEEGADATEVDSDADSAVEEEPALRAPTVEPLDIQLTEEPELSEEQGADGEEMLSPEDAAAQLEDSAPMSGDDEDGGWTLPQTVLSLHGYFRVRTQWMDSFSLGRQPLPGAAGLDPPFSNFRPVDGAGVVPAGGCGDTGSEMSTTACSTEALGFANMRLRLAPTVSLSDDVRIHALFDVFDNMVLGSTPDTLAYGPSAGGGFATTGGAATLSRTAYPPTAYRNSLADSIVARRAWAEVNNEDLGQLRFGRMGSHWGLGLLDNGGEGIDQDWSTDVDRIMAVAHLGEFYLMAGYDFAAEGFIRQSVGDVGALAYDAGQDDDVDQYVLSAVRRLTDEEQEAALARGEWVLNGGLYFTYREQLLTSAGVTDPLAPSPDVSGALVRRDAAAFIPDAWVQLRHGGLRLELEALMVAGSIENTDTMGFTEEDYNLLMFGAALEAEYRLLDDKLGLHFYSGFASGDSDVEGLSPYSGFPGQVSPDDTISTMRFHPSYNIDLILWKSILGQIAGAYYFRPGVSYDFIHDSFGQLFGLRGDIVWSRASTPVQTWGNADDLGVEIDLALYYRSEDGPQLWDGFYGSLQYGLLFPMKGLGYLEDAEGRGQFPGGVNPELVNAQTLRLILGVEY